MLDDSKAPFYKWFVGGETNTCYNALDRHVFEENRKDQAALLYDSPATGGNKRRLTYGDMLDQVQKMAGALAAMGVTKVLCPNFAFARSVYCHY